MTADLDITTTSGGASGGASGSGHLSLADNRDHRERVKTIIIPSRLPAIVMCACSKDNV